MTYSLSDVENRLYEVMEESGMSPAPGQRLDIQSGKIQRYQISGDRKGSKNGAFSVHIDDRPAGWVENWKTGEKITFTMRGLPELSAEEREAFRQQMEKARLERAQDHDKKQKDAARKALTMWSRANAPCPDFPYLIKKKINPYTLKIGKNEVKTDGEGKIKGGDQDVLYVPLFDMDTQKIINLQQIYKNGFKCPITDGKMKGVFSPIGKNQEGPILVCEGYATGASLYKLTGYTTICAMNAGNLPEIARMVKLQKPDREIVLCADNDHLTFKKTGKNPGIDYATKAADAARLGAPIYPDFTEEEDASDWNDYMILHGEDACRAHWKKKFDEFRIIAEPVPSGKMESGLFPDINIKSGKPLGTIENVEALLRFYKIQIRYNEIRKVQEIDFPKADKVTDSQLESDVNRIVSLAARHELPLGKIGNYIDTIADVNSYNPVRDWISSREWDGIPRLQLFYNTIKIQEGFDGQMAITLIRRWMLSAVAAVFCDNFWTRGVLVLQGEQGIGKTTWFRNLAPANSGWVGDGKNLNPQEKDSILGCICYWITELGELEGTFKKADMARLKAFLPMKEDGLRTPYARKQSCFKRRTVFAASVNQFQFLNDPTGTSRWWCIPCESINNKHEIDIQQVWAEVYTQYEDGHQWWLSEAEENDLKRSNWQFESPDKISDLVLQKFNWAAYVPGEGNSMTATEVLRTCGVENPTVAETMKCAELLRRLTGQKPKRDSYGSRIYKVPFPLSSRY